MFPKYCIILSLLLGASAKRSFTIVLDTTHSMVDEINVLRNSIGEVLSAVRTSSEIDNYVIMPFNDPEIGPSQVFYDSEGLIEYLSTISAKGGNDCPEDSVGALERALEISQPESHITLFTDAYARDISRLRAVEDLCRKKNVQVMIFLSGRCLQSKSSHVGYTDVFYDIARSCSGVFFKLDYVSLRQAFKYLEEVVKEKWTEIKTLDSFTDYKEIYFTVSSYTKNIIVSAFGERTVLQILETNGRAVQIERIINTLNSVAFKVIDLLPGKYKAAVNSKGKTSMTLYKKDSIPLNIGFSTRPVADFRETSSRPMPGTANYVLVSLPVIENLVPMTLEIRSNEVTGARNSILNSNFIKTIQLEKTNDDRKIYITTALYLPQNRFQIAVSGKNMDTGEDFTLPIKTLDPQSAVTAPWTAPEVEILGPIPQEYGRDLRIPCKVNGFPGPSIWWENKFGNKFADEKLLLEMPSVHISYLKLSNVTVNETIICKAKNSEGENSQDIQIVVYRPITFDIIQVPKDETIEYGTEGRLYCEVQAYPEATIKWYQNHTVVNASERHDVVAEENMLLIKNMSLEDVGSYRCEAVNDYETKTFDVTVSISGLEAPELAIEGLNEEEIILQPGDHTSFECSVIKGTPTPEVTWKYRPADSDEFNELPEGVEFDGGILSIDSVKPNHNGVYRCEAENYQGYDYRNVYVKVQYPPKIRESEERVTVREDEEVELSCDVDSVPSATVRWEVMQGDVFVQLDNRHVTKDDHTHSFKALWNDSGSYQCIAENEMGRANKTVSVNVLVKPYILAPVSAELVAYVGGSLQLACNVAYGNPHPSVKWQFISKDSVPTFIHSGQDTNVLNLRNLSRRNEGVYICIAENDIGRDTIKIHVQVR